MIRGLFNHINEWQGDDEHRPYEEKTVFRRGEPCVRPVTNQFKNMIPHREGTSPSPTKNQSTVGATLVVALPPNVINVSLEKGAYHV